MVGEEAIAVEEGGQSQPSKAGPHLPEKLAARPSTERLSELTVAHIDVLSAIQSTYTVSFKLRITLHNCVSAVA